MKKIGFDMHGSDNGMDAIVKGLKLYLSESNSKSEFFLYGIEDEVRKALIDNGLGENKNIVIVGTTEVIDNCDDAALVIRKKKQSSMVVGANALKNKELDCFVSSGSTGALVSSGIFIVGRIKGIDRPALGGMLPNGNGYRPSLIMDLGANVETKPEHMVQYAELGSKYITSLYGIESPKVALINVGSEDKKGNQLYQDVFNRLKESDLDFQGNIEARDVISTPNDVLVIDGFSGNILLKSIEGTVKLFQSSLEDAFRSTLLTKISYLLVKSKIKDMKKTFDYRELGATPVFGVKGLLLKAHGNSDAKAFKNAFRSADEIAESNFLQNIMEEK